MEYFNKWAEEAIPARCQKGGCVAQLIREHIVCKFRNPQKIITYNDTLFLDTLFLELQTLELIEKYMIQKEESSPYSPQSNDQV